MLLELCPDLADTQLSRLVSMFQDSSTGFIAYNVFLSRFTSQPPVYRRGNNLGSLVGPQAVNLQRGPDQYKATRDDQCFSYLWSSRCKGHPAETGENVLVCTSPHCIQGSITTFQFHAMYVGYFLDSN